MSPCLAQRWLAFDTSTDVLSLAVARGEQVWTQTLPGGAQASSGLIPAVLALLAEADMPLASLDAIVFGRGPGSFTGLRTACAVAQGLAFGADVPVLPVDTLLAVAEEARWAQLQSGCLAPDAQFTVWALLDARMDEVYSAAYRWQPVPGQASGRWQTVSPLSVCAPEKLDLFQTADLLDGARPNTTATAVLGPGVCLAGNAFAAYGERLPSAWQGSVRCEALPTAAALLRLAPDLWAQGLAVPAEQAMPLYIRDKVANTTAEREAMKAQTALDKAAAQP
jgi:tRNA threonylcarbamoyladenosine biosynthesis protein TsaB